MEITTQTKMQMHYVRFNSLVVYLALHSVCKCSETLALKFNCELFESNMVELEPRRVPNRI